MSNDLVVQLGASLDQFQSDMTRVVTLQIVRWTGLSSRSRGSTPALAGLHRSARLPLA